MMIIITSRGGGKTTQLIRLAAESQGYIVCMNQKEGERIASIAKDMGLNINFPITFDEFINKKYYENGAKNFLIDNVDLLIQHMTRISVHTITLSI